MSDLLRVVGLRKHFGEVRAVDGLNVHFQEGVLTSIIGPNGAGKTTLINLLSGHTQPDAGSLNFRGEDITRVPIHKRVERGINRSFQIMNIFPNLTVLQNLLLPCLSLKGKSSKMFHGVDTHREVGEAAETILQDIGLWPMRHIPAQALSHGDQRLLEIGIAMASSPRLLFLDEPTAGMNPVERRSVLEHIRNMVEAQHATFVIVEHDMDVVFSLSDRIVVMHHGQILADGCPADIRRHEAVREIYLGSEME